MAMKYVAYNWLGQKVKGVLDTDSEDTAYDMLRRQDLVPYQLRQVSQRRTLVQLMPSLFKPRSKELVDFSRQLASLLNSGIPIRRALAVLRDEASGRGLKAALTQILADIEAGSRMSDACARHPTVFPEFYIRMLRVGEATGGLIFSLQRLSETLEKRASVRAKVKGALTYPAISLAVAAIAGFALVTYALPALIDLLSEFGGDMPAVTQLLITGAEFLESFGLYFFGGLVTAVAGGVLYTRRERGKRLRDGFLLRFPVIGKIILYSNMFSFTSTFHTLISAGVPPIEALRLSGEGLNNVVLRDALSEVTRETTAGRSLGTAFRARPEFPPLLAQGITTGETTGNLTGILEGLANFYEQETDRAVHGATELIQPTVIVLVAGAVGFVAVAVISGIYSTLGAIR